MPLEAKQAMPLQRLTWPWISHAGGMLPSVTIEYRDVEIEADALVGSSSVPSLTNAAWSFIKVPGRCSSSDVRLDLYRAAVAPAACARWDLR